MQSYGVCNLTTINVVEFVKYAEETKRYELDIDELVNAQRMSVRAGLRMTLTPLEIEHWDKTQTTDRLLGASLTGFQDAVSMLNLDVETQKAIICELRDVAREEADIYAKNLRVASPLLVTTVKPEGTISQVANGVSSGLHHSHAPYYIRRIRINAADPLAQAAMAHGWKVSPEVGTPGSTLGERLTNAKTLVIDFPVASGAEKTKDDVYVDEQFETYFDFQTYYTEHNASNTIHLRPDEWSRAAEHVYDRWDEFVGVSFLSHDGGSYELAPYEAITQEEYEALAAKHKDFDPTILEIFETGADSDLDGMDGCEGGACPIR